MIYDGLSASTDWVSDEQYIPLQSPGGTFYLLDSPRGAPVETIDLTSSHSDDDLPPPGQGLQLVLSTPTYLSSTTLSHSHVSLDPGSRRLTQMFAQAEAMGVAATTASHRHTVPIVEFPDGDDHDYPMQPRMEHLIGGYLGFRGRNGVDRAGSSKYHVKFCHQHFFRIPNPSSTTFDIGWREYSSDYIPQLTAEEVLHNKMFVQAMDQLFDCQMCVGPKGGTTTLTFRQSQL